MKYSRRYISLGVAPFTATAQGSQQLPILVGSKEFPPSIFINVITSNAELVVNECSIIPAHVETNQCTYCDVISCALHHAHSYSKRHGSFMFILHIKMHVNNAIKMFSLLSYRYVCITNKVEHTQ